MMHKITIAETIKKQHNGSDLRAEVNFVNNGEIYRINNVLDYIARTFTFNAFFMHFFYNKHVTKFITNKYGRDYFNICK